MLLQIALFIHKYQLPIINLAWAFGMLVFSFLQLRDLYADERKRKLATIEANRIKTPAEVRAAHAARNTYQIKTPAEVRAAHAARNK